MKPIIRNKRKSDAHILRAVINDALHLESCILHPASIQNSRCKTYNGSAVSNDLPRYIYQFELALQEQGYQRIAGVDEAGRGALAGPVVAAAVVLPIDCRVPGVTDSKQLTPSQRARLFDDIYRRATAIGVGCVNNAKIDRINILQATMEAMRQAVAQISPPPDYVLVDGIHLPSIPLLATAIPKGDSLIHSIAAASIIAKVTRDRLMIAFDEVYPHYNFKRHKGYGTLQHRQAIAQFGPCPIHRHSFRLE